MFTVSLRIFAAVLAFWLYAGGSAQGKPITLAYNTNSLNVDVAAPSCSGVRIFYR